MVWPGTSQLMGTQCTDKQTTRLASCLLAKVDSKVGKNQKDLKNWRPITLSNCDHKIITKTISRQVSDNIDRIITGNQTAYLKRQSISDNLRIITMANQLAKKHPRMKGLIIALDAKKAFDSVNLNSQNVYYGK